ncbi:23 kDa integral membrane protein [Drosophila subpulchrella]|uniref:23 kDa integral membrane protein n=1 Tax=Drosophila subpulchrella TaxID=1486046 RepID=UPI0018A14B98|nr:23 kDa integral membrane protein [Drosophila subpulchrella]
MACSTDVLKGLALFWDIIYALFGLAVIGLGVHIIYEFEHFNTAAFVIIGGSVVVVLTAIFGALGAARESSAISKVFVVILVILIVLQIIVVGFLWAFQTSLLINVDKTFDQLWNDQPVPIKPGNQSQIASLERWLDCCGNVGPTDYVLPPNSCYNSESDKLNLEGCRQKFLDFIADRWTTFNFGALVLVGVEIICALLAYVLANSIVNRWRRSKYYAK